MYKHVNDFSTILRTSMLLDSLFFHLNISQRSMTFIQRLITLGADWIGLLPFLRSSWLGRSALNEPATTSAHLIVDSNMMNCLSGRYYT